jgi:hypothetical protein
VKLSQREKGELREISPLAFARLMAEARDVWFSPNSHRSSKSVCQERVPHLVF